MIIPMLSRKTFVNLQNYSTFLHTKSQKVIGLLFFSKLKGIWTLEEYPAFKPHILKHIICSYMLTTKQADLFHPISQLCSLPAIVLRTSGRGWHTSGQSGHMTGQVLRFGQAKFMIISN